MFFVVLCCPVLSSHCCAVAQGMLGNTVEEIAWQKAGIVKQGCPVFVPASLDPAALAVVQRECALKQAPLHITPMEG